LGVIYIYSFSHTTFGTYVNVLVCELDLVFSLHKSLLILFEMFIGGMVCESSKREVLKQIVEAEELVEELTKPGEDTASQLDDGLSFQEQFQLGRKPGRRTQGGR
jgi:Clathrin adaptor complex small chain